MTLGGWKDLSREERLEKIRAHPCVPTPDSLALHLLRVLWLRHTHQAMLLTNPWKRVLDIGCHDGFVTRWFVDEPLIEQLIGIDLCGYAVCWAEELVKIRNHPEKARYIHDDWMINDEVRELEAFDAVVCFEFIEHLDDVEVKDMFKFMDHRLKPGGIGLITTPNIEGPVGKSNPDEQHINLFSVEQLENWFVRHVEDHSSYDIRLGHSGAHIHLMWKKKE